ncbi:hypothetical protein [Catenuloplanes atrovinosus]|uniref:Uncharacterized protein n=1 Tax=Catenuloplanes atrovinosus TaxID=137266 RepID=A0AAE4CET8_9ACTN|nr:hypothetical protein [Catenuloplanes atrovinosus]MDR7278955.1 hypothetical protein [Catenuloplanes atrovinosus]
MVLHLTRWPKRTAEWSILNCIARHQPLGVGAMCRQTLGALVNSEMVECHADGKAIPVELAIAQIQSARGYDLEHWTAQPTAKGDRWLAENPYNQALRSITAAGATETRWRPLRRAQAAIGLGRREMEPYAMLLTHGLIQMVHIDSMIPATPDALTVRHSSHLLVSLTRNGAATLAVF